MNIDPSIVELLPEGVSLAEFHGTVTGLLCAQGLAETEGDILTRGLVRLLGVRWEEIEDALIEVLAETATGLDSPDLDFVLLVPEDEAPMSERLAGLAQWCSAFIAAVAESDAILEAEGEEALADLEAIAMLEIDAEEDEETEVDFNAVVEHVRVAVMLLRALSHGADEESDDESR